MSALARTTEINCDTRAANEDCINSGSRTRTKFFYDGVNRLSTSQLNGSPGLSITYATNGNILRRNDVASGGTWTYDPTHIHQVTQAGSSAFTYTYDANGNVSARNGSLIGWTSYNYPSGVGTSTESATFDYGPDRQRWRMVYSGPSGAETTYYATPMFEAVTIGGGMDYRHYIYANGRPVLVISHTTAGAVNVRSLLVDHQGSIATIASNSTGAAYATESFTAYGNRREASTWSGPPTSGELTTMNGVTREGYTFQTVLGSMGLNHMNGRIEDSITGRFLSPDPRGVIRGNTQSWNRYSYVMNNPLTLIDPTGFELCDGGTDCLTVTAGGGGGAAAGGGGGSGSASSPASFPDFGKIPELVVTAPKTSYIAGVGTQPTGNTLSVDANGLTTLTVSIYSPYVASSPATNGVNTAPYWASSAFRSFQGPMNTVANILFLEISVFNPAFADALTAVQLSQQQVAACAACALSLTAQSMEYEATIADILGEEVPFANVNLGPETETPLQSGNAAFDEALSRSIWGNNPPPIPPP